MIDLSDIRSNDEMICLHCGDVITLDNYSGWEAFTEDGKTTQLICKFCDMVMGLCNEKAESE